jgi:hypothetical protein
MKKEHAKIPDWIRRFSCPGWTNVHKLVPNAHLYPVAQRPDWKSQFNDWNGEILLLAKDGCPPNVIRERIERDESQPWRYGLPPEKGSISNGRLYGFASRIPGGKLYGSAAANMLFNEPGMSRKLEGFKSVELQKFLQRVLCWVLHQMPSVKWVACLGKESWFLTCSTLGDYLAANQFKAYRDSYRPISGFVDEKKITAFPLYHPAARGNAINEMIYGWQAFTGLLSLAESRAAHQPVPPKSLRVNRTPEVVSRGRIKKSMANNSRIVHATLPKRICRVQFMLNNKVIHTSDTYKSGNTWENIITYARSKKGGAPGRLPVDAVAVPQVLTDEGWQNEG